MYFCRSFATVRSHRVPVRVRAGAHPGPPPALLRAKGMSEEWLRARRMVWTVLQSNVFMDKLIPIVVGQPALSSRPVTRVGSGHRKHSFMPMGDVDAHTVAALDHPHARRQTILVVGPNNFPGTTSSPRSRRSWDEPCRSVTCPRENPRPTCPTSSSSC